MNSEKEFKITIKDENYDRKLCEKMDKLFKEISDKLDELEVRYFCFVAIKNEYDEKNHQESRTFQRGMNQLEMVGYLETLKYEVTKKYMEEITNV